MKRTMKAAKVLGMFWVTLALLGLAVNGACAQQKKVTKKSFKQIVVEHMQDLDNPEAGFKVDLSVDRKDATYKVGDPITFSFKTNKDCRLSLFNVGTSGKVTIIFPNEYQKDNLVKAGTEYRIPSKDAKYLFKANGPAGEDIVKAIATLEKVDLVSASDLKPPEGGFQEATKPEDQIAKDIGIVLKPIDTKNWSEAEKIIKVVP
jgi:hypothetical protein